jgi:hypothetical protein
MKMRAARIVAVAWSAVCLAAGGAAEDRTVACDEPVRGPKRGLCANAMHPEDFRAIAPGVSWWYNWHFDAEDRSPEGVSVEHVPMVWGGHPDSLAGLEARLARDPKPRVVFALNEPNLRGQAFLTPKESAAVYRAVERAAAKRGLRVVGPHMAIGTPEADSVTAFDPIQGKRVTYTFMMPWLAAFYHEAGESRIGAVGVHSYGNAGEMAWLVGMLERELSRSIWVTEFAWWDAPDSAALLDYLVRTVDLLERTPSVEGYAWFKERTQDGKLALLGVEPGTLTPLGEAYVRMPIHDPSLWFRMPGRLEAERYAAAERAGAAPTTDADGFADVEIANEGWIALHLDVPASGMWTASVRCRVDGTARLSLRVGGDGPPIRLDPEPGGWRTVSRAVRLGAGRWPVRIAAKGGAARVNWIALRRFP